MSKLQETAATFTTIAGGGQALGQLSSGKKIFAWGVLPGETATIRLTKQKSHYTEGVAIDITDLSPERVVPHDPESYLSTSPWQIIDFTSEQRYKSQLITDAFTLHGVTLPDAIDTYTDSIEYGYRNKVEFSWYGHATDGRERLDLAFFRRGSKGKIPVEGTSLAAPAINNVARATRDRLQQKGIEGRALKTLIVRTDQRGNAVFQLYTKDQSLRLSDQDFSAISASGANGGEVIYSDPRSPASRITKRLQKFGTTVLHDTLLDIPFRYAAESFFQVNLPVYEQALRDMQPWIKAGKVVDFYSGVGTIGLTVGGSACTLVEIDKHAVREMQRNIIALGSAAHAVLAPSEKALDYITDDATIVVDPPRAGLHADVTARLLETTPSRIIYLSCNPTTQARDAGLLADSYKIVYHRGYNFFPRTPHIEHLVVLDKI